MGPAGTRLVVGGGRAPGFPLLRAGDVSLNIAASAYPHVTGDIAAAPIRAGTMQQAYFERVPFTAFVGRNIRALDETARVMVRGGRVVIETGSAAPVAEIRQGLEHAGFGQIEVARISHLGGYVLRVAGMLEEAARS